MASRGLLGCVHPALWVIPCVMDTLSGVSCAWGHTLEIKTPAEVAAPTPWTSVSGSSVAEVGNQQDWGQASYVRGQKTDQDEDQGSAHDQGQG